MSMTGKAVRQGTGSKTLTTHFLEFDAYQSSRIQSSPEDDFIQSFSHAIPGAKNAFFKSSSCNNIKSSHSDSQSSLVLRDSSNGSKSRTIFGPKHASTVALPSTPGGSGNVNDDRIYVNFDLLSRVEKEKKQYEARISELTQITESRKNQIKRLAFEVRNLRKAKEQAETLIQRQGLKRKIEETNQFDGLSRPTCICPLPGPPVTDMSSQDQQSPNSSVSNFLAEEITKPSSVTNLKNRIHEMEEANYTTTEELQATMSELCEMQRTLDETQEENRNLAFERAILLESLCTQTAKLEHCRLQIEHLKHLLVTSPSASAWDKREARYVNLYASVEEEKQILLSQNNDLARRCESLDAEYQKLSEKIVSLPKGTEQLRAAVVTAAVETVHDPAATTAKPNISNKENMELSDQVEELIRQVKAWKEKFDLEVAEHESEVTELRLHERHLLRTVQIADEIRMESEAEVARVTLTTHDLRDQVKQLSEDLEKALQESSHLRDRFLKSAAHPKAISSSPLSFIPPTTLCIGTKNVATMTSPSVPASATTNVGSSESTSSTPFQYLSRATCTQKLSLTPAAFSPGGPGGNVGGGIGRTGPTVRCLIQTIENQVKAVHHHKKASAARSPVTGTKIKHGADSNFSGGDCSGLPTRRLHSAGSSPHSTPVRTISRRPLLDKSMAGDLAPGGPPPLNSIASPTSPQQPSSSQTTPTSLLSVSLDDTRKESLLLKYATPSYTCTASSAVNPTAVVTSATPRLKRHLTAPTTSLTAVAAMASSTGAVSEVASSVISAAAGESVPSATITTSASVNAPTVIKSIDSVVNSAEDPLQELAKRTDAGSKRNALLRWCQSRIAGYRGVELTNFSSSWNDGIAVCALLHTYLPRLIAPTWDSVVDHMDKQRRFEVAFTAAESQGIPTTLRLSDMLTKERPDWSFVMAYVASIYKHFEATH